MAKCQMQNMISLIKSFELTTENDFAHLESELMQIGKLQNGYIRYLKSQEPTNS